MEDIVIAKEFINLQNKLPEIIETKHLSILWLSEQSGIAYSTLRRKIQSKQFTGEELLKVMQVINR